MQKVSIILAIMKEIWIGEVLSEMNKPNSVFSIKYRKDNGDIGFKKRVTCNVTGGNLTARRKYNRSGVVLILDLETREERNITIDLITRFNNLKVRKSKNYEWIR